MYLVFRSLPVSLCLCSLIVQMFSHEVYHHHHYPDGKHIIYHETSPHPPAATCIAPATIPHHPSLISKILALAKEYLTSSHSTVSLFKPTHVEEVHTDPSKIPHYFHFHEHIDFSHEKEQHKHHHDEHHHHGGGGGDHNDHGHKEEHHHESHNEDHDDHGHESKQLQQIHDEAAKRKIYLALLNSKIKIVSSDAIQMQSAASSSNGTSFDVTMKQNEKNHQQVHDTVSLASTPKPMVLVPIFPKRLEIVPEGKVKSETVSSSSSSSTSATHKQPGDNSHESNNSHLQKRYKFPPPQPYTRDSKPRDLVMNGDFNGGDTLPVDSPEFPFPVSNAEDVVSLMQQKTPVRTHSQLLGQPVYSKNHYDSHESARIDTWTPTHKGNLDESINLTSSLLQNHKQHEELILQLNQLNHLLHQTSQSSSSNNNNTNSVNDNNNKED